MDLKEYLQAEGIEDLSRIREPWKIVKARINPDLCEAHSRLVDDMAAERSPEVIINAYNFALAHGIYPIEESFWYERSITIMPEVFRRISGCKDILDVGCSAGLKLVYYAQQQPTSNFTGLDLSQKAVAATLERARKYGLTNIKALPGNIETLEGHEQEFDCVVSEYCLNETAMVITPHSNSPRYSKKLEKIKRLLKTGGRAVIALQERSTTGIIEDFHIYCREVGLKLKETKVMSYSHPAEYLETALFVATKE